MPSSLFKMDPNPFQVTQILSLDPDQSGSR